MDKARLGFVGLGWFGGVLAEKARSTGTAEIVSSFARSPDARARFVAEHGGRSPGSLEDFFDDGEFDGVVLATPHSTHADLIEMAAASGKHVFVEKPLALTVADARRAISATESAGVTLQVGHNRRRQPANRRIKQMIDSGDLGTVLQLAGNQSGPLGHKPDLPAWRADPAESPAGGMTGMGVHIVDTFHYWVGPAKRVTAFTKRIVGLREIDEATMGLIEYESGPLAMIGTSLYVPATNTVTAYGTDASAWNEDDGARLFIQQRSEPTRTEDQVGTLDTLADEIEEFVRCILEGAQPETGPAEGLEVAAISEAMIASAGDGRAVELSEVR
jgi:predicted dehydrogenase